MDLGQLTQTEAMGSIPEQGLTIEVEPGATDVLAFELGSPHTSPDALNNKVAFQLGYGADDDYNSTAQWTAGVDVFPEADELDVEMI